MAYNIKLDIFEGPLDLLLHLIKRNEVDIYDIPIALVTAQYLEYIEMMKEMNLDLAGEFLVMAATLVHIKSKMLLPPDESAAEDEEDGVDPRDELVRRLLEYQRYKEAARELSDKTLLGRDVFARGPNVSLEGLDADLGFVDVSVFEIMEALKVILERAPKGKTIELSVERFKIADKINYVMEKLGAERSATFTSLFPEEATRGEIIVTFLAVLELVKLLMIRIHQTEDRVIRVYIPAVQAEEALAAEGNDSAAGEEEGNPDA